MSELTQEHIEKLVTHFYNRIQEDALLGPIFNDIAQVDWIHHIPLLCQFWNSIMLKTNEYKGSAYAKHLMLAKKADIKEIHFTHWLVLFQEEARKHLPAQSAEEIIKRAALIAESLKYGILSNKL